MKYTIIMSVVSAVLHIVGVWISGWQFERGESAVSAYVAFLLTVGLVGTVGFYLDKAFKE